MSIKKLGYYLVNADITLGSDPLPLKKFLTKNTLNSKVNNWAVDISPFRITFEYMSCHHSLGGDRSDTKHSKCLLLGGRRLNQLTLIPKPKGSGGARAATAQVGPANNRNDTKRCLPVEASLRPGEAVPW